MSPIIIGAVLYDPKVSVIWEIIRDFFEQRGVPITVRLYANYDRQNTALIGGEIDIAWNSPLAWLQAQRMSGNTCRAIAMRDTDRDRRSHLIVATASGIESIAELRGQTIAFGAKDSPQARLIPQELLLQAGLRPGSDYVERRFDLLVGLHGDHIGGEREAFLCLKNGEASASAMIDLNWEAWIADGTIAPDRFRILATTEPYDHCVFTVRGDFDLQRQERWLGVLHSMDYADPQHREMMDLEGLKRWEPGRATGFAALTRALEAFQI